MKNRLAVLFPAVLAFLPVCVHAVPADERCPYAVSGTLENGTGKDAYRYAGMELRIFNRSDKAVLSCTVVFYVYDENGESPFTGTNSITADCCQYIDPQKEACVSVSLDGFLSETPAEPYQYDYLYISRIVYEDGSVWEDPYGVYAL